MTTYRAKTGHDIVLGSLTVLSPQPDPGGAIQYTRVTTAADGTITRQGPYFEFRWTELDNSDYATILGIFGIGSSATASNPVTIYIRDVTYQAWTRLNGIAQQPIPGDTINWNLRPQNVVIRVTHLDISANLETNSSDGVTVADSITVAVI